MHLITLAIITAFAIGDGHTPGVITASGAPVRAGITLACDPEHYQFGQQIWIQGIGIRTCQDTGGAIKGKARFDLAFSTPQEAREFGRQSLRYAPLPLPQASKERRLIVYHGKTERWACSYYPMRDGAYTARHCLANVRGPGFTIYAGTERVTRFTLDPLRDLAHMIITPAPVPLRTPVEGETALLRSSQLVAGGIEYHTFTGIIQDLLEVRRWCVVSGPWYRVGISGDGVIGYDGALLGIVTGGTLDPSVGLADPYCGGTQSIFTTEVP